MQARDLLDQIYFTREQGASRRHRQPEPVAGIVVYAHAQRYEVLADQIFGQVGSEYSIASFHPEFQRDRRQRIRIAINPAFCDGSPGQHLYQQGGARLRGDYPGDVDAAFKAVGRIRAQAVFFGCFAN